MCAIQLNRYERILQSAGQSGARLAAASVHARQAIAATSAHERAIRDVGAGVAGPLLVTYVLWILFDARARGIKRLYFLSRDGQVLHALADILAPRLEIAVERRYLYASRKGWNCGGDWLLRDWDLFENFTLDKFLNRLSMPLTALAADLASLGLEKSDAVLGPAEIERLQEYVASDRFAAAAATAQAEHKRLLEGYLEQEDVFDVVPKALVDLGGHGTQHATLSELLVKKGAEPCPLYLFWSDPSTSPWIKLRQCFYHDGGDRVGELREALPQIWMPLETFCSAEHGTLTGFEQNEDKIDPRLAPVCTTELTEWGLHLLRETLSAFARSIDLSGLEPTEIHPIDNAAFRKTMEDLLNTFWLTPTKEEARAWGSFPVYESHADGSIPLAEPYVAADFFTIWRRNTFLKRSVFWIKGSYALTPYPLAVTLRGLFSARRRARRLPLKIAEMAAAYKAPLNRQPR